MKDRSVVLTFLTLLGAVPPLAAQQSIRRQVIVMGTQLQLDVVAPTRAVALQSSEAVVRAVEAVEQRLSTWCANSEVSRVNAAALGEPVRLAGDTWHDLQWAFGIAERTGHAFDPTVGSLVETYRLPTGGRWPSTSELALALAAMGPTAFGFDAGAVVRRASGARLATDAFAKGVALDRAGVAAMAAGATGSTFDFGGQWAVFGDPGREISVALAHPEHRGAEVARLRVRAGQSAATSGNGDRRATVDGRSLGHLFDPRNGQPAADFGSVTAIAQSAALADAASTALFVLGPERGLQMARELGIEAVFVECLGEAGAAKSPRAVRLRMTPGLHDFLVTTEQPR